MCLWCTLAWNSEALPTVSLVVLDPESRIHVLCAVNDPFVMSAWGQANNVEGKVILA
jgi:hypothetical protein